MDPFELVMTLKLFYKTCCHTWCVKIKMRLAFFY